MVEQLGDLLALSVPIAGIVLTLCLTALAIYLDYKKKMAMIEKGLVPEDEKPKPANRLGWGIAILGIGISFVAARLFNLDAITTGGLILTSIGMALLVSNKISKQQQ
ncbi:MAG TPA: DUF6249 domain-containing protein [Candidatus Methanoperedens sp.]|nr:DUF6249 domain-containing protein [Candidatus Methanoperedens sp.]